jgi:aquaporin Z
MIDYLAESLATFFFVSVILWIGQPIPIVLALLIAIYVINPFSKAHINPAVSFGMLIKGDVTGGEFCGYATAQLIGGALAALLFKNLYNSAQTSGVVKAK